MNIIELPGQFRKINRLRAMALVFARYEIISVAERLAELNPVFLVSKLVGHAETIPKKENQAYLIRSIIEDLGTTYVKFGQWLSVRPDFVPPEMLRELEHLQDRLPPVRLRTIRRTIRQELGQPLETIFSVFDPVPLSTASIAQVHRAMLHSGEEVVVKVQHPNLKRVVSTDISILRSMADWAVGQWPELALHRPGEAIEAFRDILMDEINFIQEAKNQDRLGQIFAESPEVKIPNIYWEYTTERLLVMELLRGTKLGDDRSFQELQLDPKRLAQRLSDSMFRQIFEEAFFHADPHPGNILFMPDNVIGYVDFGIVSRFSDTLLDLFLDWFYAVIYKDLDIFEETFLTVGKPLKHLDRIQFRNDLVEYLDEIHFQPANRISFVRLFDVMNRIMYRHKLSTPSTFLIFFKTISTLEGVARRVDPEFDWRQSWGPKIEKIIHDRHYLGGYLRKYRRAARNYERLIVDYPEDYREIVQKIKEGKFEIEIQFPELQNLIHETKRALSKVAMALIFSSVIFGLFYLGRGQGDEFQRWIFEHIFDIVWIFISILLLLIYIRR